MATFTKRGSRWLVQVRRKGFVPQTKTFATKADAAAWATVQEAKVEQGEDAIPSRLLFATTLADIINKYLEEVTPQKRSASTEHARLSKLKLDAICAVNLAKLSSADVAKYRDRRLEVVLPGTVRRELSLIHHAIETARREWGYVIPTNPAALVSRPRLNNARDRRLRHGELERLTDALATTRNSYVGLIVRFAIETAMRRGEILNLEWSHVRISNRTLHIPVTKTGKARTIPLTDSAVEILQQIAAEGRLVFPVSVNAFKLAWQRAVKRAKLHDLRFHDLRHEAISRFFELGLSMPEVSLISGHRDPRMLFRYTHLQPHHLVDKLRGKQWSDRVAP